MWLILCDPTDLSAIWAGQGLRARGLNDVEFVSTMELVCAERIHYRAEGEKLPEAHVRLARGRRIDVRRLRGTLNRARPVRHPQLACAAPADRSYVSAELDSTVLAWLGALTGSVYNPPHASGWSGVLRHPFEWALKAQQAGFRTLSFGCDRSGLRIPTAPSGPISSHIVLDGRAFPELPPALEHAAARLAKDVGLPLMGLHTIWDEHAGPIFLDAVPDPDLRTGGQPFLDALHHTFANA